MKAILLWQIINVKAWSFQRMSQLITAQSNRPKLECSQISGSNVARLQLLLDDEQDGCDDEDRRNELRNEVQVTYVQNADDLPEGMLEEVEASRPPVMEVLREVSTRILAFHSKQIVDYNTRHSLFRLTMRMCFLGYFCK